MNIQKIKHIIGLGLAALSGIAVLSASAQNAVPVFEAQILEQFDTFDARQAVAVDAEAFYAINNFRITRHDKRTGEAQLQWDGVSDETGPLTHLDSGMVYNGRLYAAHSNYPHWPMSSSIEIWDSRSLEHVASHSFGIQLGSMTWIDRHDGFWWGGFGNYDKVQDGQQQPYGETRFSQVVRMNDAFEIIEQWMLPAALHPRLSPMSNSGGTWGSDAYLYLTGHDYPEIYVMRLPVSGGVLDWVATVHVPGLNGQGIAWDRSGEPDTLWAMLKRDRRVFKIRMPEIRLADAKPVNVIRKPGNFSR
ncbi:MAG: hypothetical protein RQ899_02535 [Pseudomonadales bacterium]|nr:hypothetical protein [Pseudomonadales bacterium]